jgi:hypothetical protein
VFEMIADVETILNTQKMDKNSKDILRNRIANVMHNHSVRNDSNLDMEERCGRKMCFSTKLNTFLKTQI